MKEAFNNGGFGRSIHRAPRSFSTGPVPRENNQQVLARPGGRSRFRPGNFSSRESTPPPPRASIQTSFPGQPPISLADLVGPIDPKNPWSAAEAAQKASSLQKQGWEFMFNGKPISPVIGTLPAHEQLVWPRVTVSNLLQKRGRPPANPSQPCVYMPGGIVGSSRRSRSRAARTGRPPWRAGERHADWLPLERVSAFPPGGNRTCTPDQSYQQSCSSPATWPNNIPLTHPRQSALREKTIRNDDHLMTREFDPGTGTVGVEKGKNGGGEMMPADDQTEDAQNELVVEANPKMEDDAANEGVEKEEAAGLLPAEPDHQALLEENYEPIGEQPAQGARAELEEQPMEYPLGIQVARHQPPPIILFCAGWVMGFVAGIAVGLWAVGSLV